MTEQETGKNLIDSEVFKFNVLDGEIRCTARWNFSNLKIEVDSRVDYHGAQHVNDDDDFAMTQRLYYFLWPSLGRAINQLKHIESAFESKKVLINIETNYFWYGLHNVSTIGASCIDCKKKPSALEGYDKFLPKRLATWYPSFEIQYQCGCEREWLVHFGGY